MSRRRRYLHCKVCGKTTPHEGSLDSLDSRNAGGCMGCGMFLLFSLFMIPVFMVESTALRMVLGSFAFTCVVMVPVLLCTFASPYNCQMCGTVRRGK
jgi:hypothetical protein